MRLKPHFVFDGSGQSEKIVRAKFRLARPDPSSEKIWLDLSLGLLALNTLVFNSFSPTHYQAGEESWVKRVPMP